jgi:hypothetical protein
MEMTATPGENRRRSARFPIRVELKLLAPDQHMLLLSHTMDLSVHGALVRANRELPIGARVRVSIFRELPQEPLLLNAEVVRIADGDGERLPGVGLHFFDTSRETEHLLRELILDYGAAELEEFDAPV